MQPIENQMHYAEYERSMCSNVALLPIPCAVSTDVGCTNTKMRDDFYIWSEKVGVDLTLIDEYSIQGLQ